MNLHLHLIIPIPQSLQKTIYTLIFSLFICSPFTPHAHAAPNPTNPTNPPNIVFIMADDMGIDWVSTYNAPTHTPNIDKLAKQGLRFKTAWSNPICTPTRLTLLTGMYPFRTGWTDHHDVPRWGGKGYIPTKFPSFARSLKAAGYTTAIAGKWQVNDLRKQKDILQQHGFDEHCLWTGWETGNVPPSSERYWNPYIQTNNKRQIHKGQFGPKVFNDFILNFITKNKNKPFLAYYPLCLPHGPLVHTPDNLDQKDIVWRDKYPGMVKYIDKLVGNVVNKIDELGLTNNTVFIFTGDNGSPVAGQIGNQQWIKGKGRIQNYGMHVPLIIRAPMFKYTPGQTSNHLVDFSDFYPTFLELAGAKQPNKQIRDGISFIPALNNLPPSTRRSWIYAQRGQNRAIRNQQYKLDNQGGFFDLNKDPLEKNNLMTSTDPQVAAARIKLQQTFKALPKDAPAPFEGFKPSLLKKKKRPKKNKSKAK